ncbi:MAG: DNA modification methylase [Candidatus Omnitrophica bacterium]|nr:DNA modification methylase [Candidatus Omnitrophota bacterium]
MTKPIIDSEFHALIPPLSDDERIQLEANIKAEGCRDALVTWKGILVDGHNRFEICERLKIPYTTTAIELKDRAAATEWIIRNQFGRRNLSAYQRAELALRLEPIIAARAKERMMAGKRLAPSQISGQGKTDKNLASIAGVSHDTIHKAKIIAARANDETKARLRTGDTSINAEYNKIAQDDNLKIRRERFVSETKAALSERPVIVNGDCLEILKTIPPIDLLLTDPPYFTDGDFTAHISECLARVKPTGQAYVFASADPAEIAAYLGMDTHGLKLEQILIWNYNNTGQRQPNKRYTSNYQIIFYYRGQDAPAINKPSDGTYQYACQTVNAPDGRIGDRFHEWQKPIALIERLIRNSSKPGDFVFDPFAGTGTTILAAAKLGRKTSGCEINKDNLKICIDRGCVYEP